MDNKKQSNPTDSFKQPQIINEPSIKATIFLDGKEYPIVFTHELLDRYEASLKGDNLKSDTDDMGGE